MDGFMTPPKHEKFLAKKLFADVGEIIDGSIAYIEPGGGGPTEPHTHPHSHLFTVTEGEAEITLGERVVTVKKDESFLVDGNIPHSVWNRTNARTVMLGISVVPKTR